MSSWHTQAEVDEVMKSRVAAQLASNIAAYDGSPAAAKEILRGLVAVHALGLVLRPFEDALAERHRLLGLSAA
jgi:hypothetical protein